MPKFRIEFSNGIVHENDFRNHKFALIEAREMAVDMQEEDLSIDAQMFDYPTYKKPTFVIKEI